MTEHYRTRIAAERQRQIDVEGYTAEHDERHEVDLLSAALCYANEANRVERGGHPQWMDGSVPFSWPWAPMHWKPGTPERMREKAGALALAAIDAMADGPDLVTTQMQLDTLPDDTVVRDGSGDVFVRAFEYDGRVFWGVAGTSNTPHPSHVIDLPAVVLYRGSAS